MIIGPLCHYRLEIHCYLNNIVYQNVVTVPVWTVNKVCSHASFVMNGQHVSGSHRYVYDEKVLIILISLQTTSGSFYQNFIS